MKLVLGGSFEMWVVCLVLDILCFVVCSNLLELIILIVNMLKILLVVV